MRRVSIAAPGDRAGGAGSKAAGHERLSRVLIVAALVAAGVGLAWPFRHGKRELERPAGDAIVDVPLRRQDVPPETSPPGEKSPALPLDEEPDRLAAVQRVLPPDIAAPPILPQDFSSATPNHQGPVIRTDWQPARLKMPTSQPGFRRHRLTDGDSLERLAERYLQNADRAGEIYDANRDVLAAPDLLPLGKIIRIPPREPAHD